LSFYDLNGTNVAKIKTRSVTILVIELKGQRVITVMVVVKVRPGKQEEFLQAMRSLQNDRIKEKGIRGSKVFEDGGRTSFCLMDEWETVEDLERYCQGESFRVFLGALKTLCAEAEIKYGSFLREG
jgi:quinol monooxygenase YgiN